MMMAAHAPGAASASGKFTSVVENPKEARFSPYVSNGGTVVGVAGQDYCVLASDTRLSLGFSILSRDCPRVTKLTSKCCIATAGMQADTLALHKMLQYRLKMYKHQNGKEMSTDAIAQMLSITLYNKRFFPYYTFNIVGGIDPNGEGAVYSYDAIGTMEKMKYTATGSGAPLIEPFLDSQVGYKNQLIKPDRERTKDEAVELVKDTFATAGERDIYTGDAVDIMVMTADGLSVEKFPLKQD